MTSFIRTGCVAAVTIIAACVLVVAAADSGVTSELFASLPYRYIGPPGNRVEVVAGIPGDPLVIYAGTPSGGVFKTTDGGLHWDSIFDSQSVASIGAIAIAPSNPSVVWVGTGESFIRGNISVGNGVYKSTDAGKSWTRVGLEKSGRVGRIVIDPANPNVALVAALGHCYGPQPDRGVYRTSDGGKTWARVLFVDESTGAVDLAMDPSNPRTMFAATWQFAIYPWWAESGGPGSGVFVSRDEGQTWSRITGHGLPDGPLGRIALAIAPSAPKRVYAAIEHAGEGTLFRSDDSGANWTIASRDPGVNRRARYFSRFTVFPDNPDELYFLTQSLGHSLDGGATMTAVPEVFPDQHDVWIDPKDPNRHIVANDRYVNISRDRGRTWFRAGLPNAQIYRVSTDHRVPYNVFGARQDGPTYAGPSNSLIPNGLITSELWEYAGYSESGWAIPDRSNEDVLWVSDNKLVERYNLKVHSTRPASPWPARRGPRPPAEAAPNERQYRINWTAPFAVSPHDPHTAYAGSQFLHRTTDGGATWTVISPDLTTNDKTRQGPSPGLQPDNQDAFCVLFAIAESPRERGVIWTGSNDGLVQLTRDDGQTWSNVTAAMPGLPPHGSISSIDPSRHANGAAYVSVDRHRANDSRPYIFKTVDYGRSWRMIGGGIPVSEFSYVRVVREDPKRAGLLYAGTENGVFVSFDDGGSWVALQNNLPHVPVSWMTIQEDFDDLVISTFGRGFWIFDDLSPLQQLTPDVLRRDIFLFQPRSSYLLRPGMPMVGSNLAADFDTPSDAGHNPPQGAPITYYLRTAAASDVTLTIRSRDGKVVKELKGPKSAGINRVWWDLYAETPPPAPRGLPYGSMNRPTPLVPPGAYTITVSVGGAERSTTLTLRTDPNSDWR